jgi:hypothetical protein
MNLRVIDIDGSDVIVPVRGGLEQADVLTES